MECDCCLLRRFCLFIFVTFAYKTTSKFNINSIQESYEDYFIFRQEYLNEESHIETIVTTKKKLQKTNKEDGTNRKQQKRI